MRLAQRILGVVIAVSASTASAADAIWTTTDSTWTTSEAVAIANADWLNLTNVWTEQTSAWANTEGGEWTPVKTTGTVQKAISLVNDAWSSTSKVSAANVYSGWSAEWQRSAASWQSGPDATA
jgi:hypothetical protein